MCNGINILLSKYDDLLAIASCIVGNNHDAEDVLQEIVVELLEKPKDIANVALLKKITRRRSSNWNRNKREYPSGTDFSSSDRSISTNNRMSWALSYVKDLMDYNAPENY